MSEGAPLPIEANDDPEAALRTALGNESGLRKWGARAVGVLAFAALLTGGAVYRLRHLPPPPPTFATTALRVGDVIEVVRASGTVVPLRQVNVQAQTGGVIGKVLVDFNSQVKKGDVLAEIDASVLASQVSQQAANLAAQKAQLQSANAALASAQLASQRTSRLFEKGAASQTEMEAAKAALDSAQAAALNANANVAAVQAQLGRARVDALSSKLVAPIDGVVVSRDVDPGTLVTVGGAAPLFVLAENLRRMRVIANVDEADIGKLRVGQPAQAVVDAYPGRAFTGNIEQLRLAPRTLQGVVTYATVIGVDNADLALRPGMTAMVTVTIAEARNVPLVPNAALRFALTAKGEPPDMPAPANGERVGRVYELTSAEPGRESLKPTRVTLGISDGVQTELVGSALIAGTLLVTDRLIDDSPKR